MHNEIEERMLPKITEVNTVWTAVLITEQYRKSELELEFKSYTCELEVRRELTICMWDTQAKLLEGLTPPQRNFGWRERHLIQDEPKVQLQQPLGEAEMSQTKEQAISAKHVCPD
jgi:hypothetical protein